MRVSAAHTRCRARACGSTRPLLRVSALMRAGGAQTLHKQSHKHCYTDNTPARVSADNGPNTQTIPRASARASIMRCRACRCAGLCTRARRSSWRGRRQGCRRGTSPRAGRAGPEGQGQGSLCPCPSRAGAWVRTPALLRANARGRRTHKVPLCAQAAARVHAWVCTHARALPVGTLGLTVPSH